MQHNKRALLFLMLMILTIGLVAFNVYLWELQTGKKQLVTGLQSQIELHKKENKLLSERNASKYKEIETLQSPDSHYVYEEKAREEYGMIGKNETYFVLTNKDLTHIPDLLDKKHQTTSQDDTLAMPNNIKNQVVTLESLDKSSDSTLPNRAPSPRLNVELPPEPPLQLESLQ